MSGSLDIPNEKVRASKEDIIGNEVAPKTFVARAEVIMSSKTLSAVMDGNIPKGDVLAVARIAGIMGGKKTSDLLPLSNHKNLESLKVDVTPDRTLPGIRIEATSRVHNDVEADIDTLTAALISALTIYDMLKSMEKGIKIVNIGIVS